MNSDLNLSQLHSQTMNNRGLMGKGGLCSCFYCCSVYPSRLIEHWNEEKDRQFTALCMLCYNDTIVHESQLPEKDRSVLPMKNLMKIMHKKYFQVPGE